MTKRFPKMESKREFRIGCFKYKGRDRVTGIKFLPTSASELWQALNIPKSQNDLVMLKLNIHTARFMVNWAFPLMDCEDCEANQLKSPVQAPGTVGLQSPCILRRTHTHTDIHESMRLLIWEIWQKNLHLSQHSNWERRLTNKTLYVKMAERIS